MELHEAYKVLGLLPGADETLVRAAYRARAKRDHPDFGGSQEAFIRSEQAFRCIESAGFPSGGQAAGEPGPDAERDAHDSRPGPGPERDWPGWHWSEPLGRWVCDAHHGSECDGCRPESHRQAQESERKGETWTGEQEAEQGQAQESGRESESCGQRILFAIATLLVAYLFNTYCRPLIDYEPPTETAAPAESPVDVVQRVMCSQVARWCTVTPEYVAANIVGACVTLAKVDPYWTLSNGEITRVLSDTSAQAVVFGMSTEEQALEINSLNGAVLALRAELC